MDILIIIFLPILFDWVYKDRIQAAYASATGLEMTKYSLKPYYRWALIILYTIPAAMIYYTKGYEIILVCIFLIFFIIYIVYIAVHSINEMRENQT